MLCLERCLQLRPSNVDALKALALFHLDVRRDRDAAVPLLEKLADVRMSRVLTVTLPIIPLSCYLAGPRAQGVGFAAAEGVGRCHAPCSLLGVVACWLLRFSRRARLQCSACCGEQQCRKSLLIVIDQEMTSMRRAALLAVACWAMCLSSSPER